MRSLPGIRLKGRGWEAYIRVNGQLRSRTFPLDTSPAIMEAWRIDQRADRRPIARDALGRASVRYLQTVRHQPDRVNKRHYLQRWLRAFGKYRRLATITAAEIETVLSGWLMTLAPTTVRHHRTVLIQLYRATYGRTGLNPALETPRPKDREPEARAARLVDVARVFRWLPRDVWRARLLLILAVGLPHKQIGALTPEDWDRARRQLRVTGRSKGSGARGRLMPLSSTGQAALREFARVKAWGPFHPSNLHKRVTAACHALKVPRFRPYDLRHTHGTLLYEATGDLKTVARLLGHVGTKTTERYTQTAAHVLDQRATAKVGIQLRQMLETRTNRRKMTRSRSLRS